MKNAGKRLIRDGRDRDSHDCLRQHQIEFAVILADIARDLQRTVFKCPARKHADVQPLRILRFGHGLDLGNSETEIADAFIRFQQQTERVARQKDCIARKLLTGEYPCNPVRIRDGQGIIPALKLRPPREADLQPQCVSIVDIVPFLAGVVCIGMLRFQYGVLSDEALLQSPFIGAASHRRIELLQLIAAQKSVIFDPGNALRNCDAGQVCAVVKCAIRNERHRIRNHDAGNLVVFVKRIVCNGSHRLTHQLVRNNQIGLLPMVVEDLRSKHFSRFLIDGIARVPTVQAFAGDIEAVRGSGIVPPAFVIPNADAEAVQLCRAGFQMLLRHCDR